MDIKVFNLAILASIFLSLVLLPTVVFSMADARNASESDFSICGIIPFQGLNPWMVQVFAQIGSGTMMCGGSFISSKHILTAAHCVDIDMSSDSRYHIYFHRRYYEASLVAFEPNYYDYDYGDYHDIYHYYLGATDLAILEVKEKPRSVVPLCLPPKNYVVQNTDLILTSPRGGYHEKVISVIDGKACWQRVFRNDVATMSNSNWCGKDQEFKMVVEAYEEYWRNEIKDFDLKSSKMLCSAKLKGETFGGDSGSPLVQQDQNGRWNLIAIVKGFNEFNWKPDICDLETKRVTVDVFQPLVPNLSWIYETLNVV